MQPNDLKARDLLEYLAGELAGNRYTSELVFNDVYRDGQQFSLQVDLDGEPLTVVRVAERGFIWGEEFEHLAGSVADVVALIEAGRA